VEVVVAVVVAVGSAETPARPGGAEEETAGGDQRPGPDSVQSAGGGGHAGAEPAAPAGAGAGVP
jgi:hypothetical protein